jgi:hypothetical protein
MQVRDMKGNPSIWEELSWSDLSSREKAVKGARLDMFNQGGRVEVPVNASQNTTTRRALYAFDNAVQ